MDGSGEHSSRIELRRWLETLRGLELTDPEVEAAAERLRAERVEALPVVLEQFADPEEDAALLAVATVALKGWAEPHPVEALMALLRSPGVGALAKALIMTVLERHGIDAPGSDLFGVGVNLDEYDLDGGGRAGGAAQN